MSRRYGNLSRRLTRWFRSEPLILELSEEESERLREILRNDEGEHPHDSSTSRALLVAALVLSLLAAVAVASVILGVIP